MKLDYLKEKKELVSVVLLGVSAVLAVLILVKVTGFFTAPAKAELLVKKAVVQNNTDANDTDKYFVEYKKLAKALKENNLFVPPAQEQHPIKEVWGIFGNEVLIKDKWYKVGDTVGEAKIVAIGPTEVTIEWDGWDGKEKTFAPIDAKGSSQPGGSRATARGGPPRPGGGSAQMVTIQSQGKPTGGPGGGMERMKERFQNMPESERVERMKERFQNMSESERDRFMAEMKKRKEQYKNMSEAERTKFKSEMIEKFGGGGPGGGKRGGK